MRSSIRTTTAALIPLVLAACGSGTSEAGNPPTTTSAGPIPEGAVMPADHPDIAVPGTGTDAPAIASDADARTDTVLELTSSAGYTYARMDMDGDEMWVAGPQAPIAEGDEMTMSGLMKMTGFHSSSLDRTFDEILFVSRWARISR